MTLEDIKKARAIIDAACPDPFAIGSTEFIAIAKTEWPKALDEIERLQKLDNPYAVDQAVYQMLYTQEQNNKLKAEIERLQKDFDEVEPHRNRLFFLAIIAFESMDKK